jgi:ABC-2 type transport system permease protein
MVRDEKFATVMVVGFVLPVLLLSGLFWPRDAMLSYFYYISNMIPQSWAIDGLREVMFRGQGVHNFKVILGLCVPIAWSVIFIVLASVFLRFR